MAETGWRIVLITTVQPIAENLLPVLLQLGREPVAILSARRPAGQPVRRFHFRHSFQSDRGRQVTNM